jgi:hypothetical protein
MATFGAPALSAGDLNFLERQIKRSALYDIAVGAPILLFGLALTAAGPYGFFTTAIGPKVFVLAAVGLLAVWGGWAVLGSGLRTFDPTKHRLHEVLTKRPQDIVWVHGVEGDVNALRIWFLDGTYDDVNALRNNAAALMEIIARTCPDVLLGYGAKQEREYKVRVSPQLIPA